MTTVLKRLLMFELLAALCGMMVWFWVFLMPYREAHAAYVESWGTATPVEMLSSPWLWLAGNGMAFLMCCAVAWVNSRV